MDTKRLALLFVLLSVCDATFTVCFVIGGYGTEVNIFLKDLVENYPSALPLIKFASASVIALVGLHADRKGHSWGKYGLIACSLFYGGVLLWNYKELLFG